MTGIKYDADWVGGYAKLTEASAAALEEGVRTMATDPLTDESFGQLGRTVNTTQAYASAAQRLRDQLDRAVAALRSASTGLDEVTRVYQDTDDEGAATVTRGQGV